MKEISLNELKNTLKDIHLNTESRKFCFVLGAGASYSSGIPTGGELAKQWFKDIEERYSKEEVSKWSRSIGLKKRDIAAHYGAIYKKRFEHDKTSGYEFLVQAMRTAKPTFGHFVLAQILTKAPGNCVITTNFDSLIEASVYQFTDKTPLVCGHESLSGYARPSNIHPLIVKIHRDLLLSPKSSPDEIATLDALWKEPLDHIFSTHIPIVIGYGGNDGSLMQYFEKMTKPSNFFWCGHVSSKPSARVKKLIEQMEGSCVQIDGFDEMMLDLLWVYDEIKPIKEELDIITKDRIGKINGQFDKLNTQTKAKRKEENGSNELSAFEYSRKAENESDFELRKQIYLEALDKFPKTGWLWNEFTYFVHYIKKEFKSLEKYYKLALDADPKNVYNNLNFANLLMYRLRDYKRAEHYYLRALSLDPEYSTNHGSYAVFLALVKKDYAKAEEYFQMALDRTPDSANKNGNYAGFLFITGRNEEAIHYLDTAFQLNGRAKSDLLLELYFYMYAHIPKQLQRAEKEINNLLNKGIQSVGWILDENVRIAIENNHPNPEKLKEFATRITVLPESNRPPVG